MAVLDRLRFTMDLPEWLRATTFDRESMLEIAAILDTEEAWKLASEASGSRRLRDLSRDAMRVVDMIDDHRHPSFGWLARHTEASP